MKWTMNKIALSGIVLLAIVLSCSTAFAQNNSVKASLDFQMYDVIYLTDFVDIKNQQLNPNISGISLSMSSTSTTPPKELLVCVYVELHVQLRGEADQELMHLYTNNFDMIKNPVLAANNFAKGGSGNIYIRDGLNTYVENGSLRQRLEDMAAKNPTAPPGKYSIIMQVLTYPSIKLTDRGVPTNVQVLGQDAKTVTVQFSTADEVFVEINDPKNGSFFNNLAPTFSWTTGESNVTVSVYEALPTQRSPQDALTGGNPCLVRTVTGQTSLTYPSDAQRQLAQNKSYVLQVQAIVSTNRGNVMQSSLPIVFRISDDKVGQMLDNFLNALSGSASATYSTLRADPNNWIAWSPYGNITLDGSTLTETDLQSLVNDLASRSDLTIQLGVENQ
ncbi:MAG: hypothetical protein ABSC53_00410 [Bacteroidota bacterium]